EQGEGEADQWRGSHFQGRLVRWPVGWRPYRVEVQDGTASPGAGEDRFLEGHPRRFCRGKDEITRACRVRRSAAFCCGIPRWRYGDEQNVQRTTDGHRLCRHP